MCITEPYAEEHAFYAVKTGLEMQEKVKRLVEKWRKLKAEGKILGFNFFFHKETLS